MSNVLLNKLLFNQQGSSDKVFQIQLVDEGNDFMVYCANNRRGKPLKPRAKWEELVNRETAQAEFDRIYKAKTSKRGGYTESTDGGETLEPAANANQKSSVTIQLLNAIDETIAIKLCNDPKWVAQQKFDGERRPIEIKGGVAQGLNRYCEYVGGMKSSVIGGIDTSVDAEIDTEDLDTQLAAFDILSLDGKCLRNKSFIDRYAILAKEVEKHDSVILSELAVTTEEKLALFSRVKEQNLEGLVFKLADATFTENRPSSGGEHLKFKFYYEASVLATGLNNKRSVKVAVFDENGEKCKVAM